jgi:hypothetical protein
MHVPTGAGPTVGANAGFAHLGQGAFESRPQEMELVEKVLLKRGTFHFFVLHKGSIALQCMHIQ